MIKILSLNIHKGFGPFNYQLTIPNLKILLESIDVDIVFLQEVVGKNIKNEKKRLAWSFEGQLEFLADQKWRHYNYAKNAVYRSGHHGNAILSKYPIKKYKNYNISTNRFEQRGLLYCEIEAEKPLHCFCTHLNLLHRDRKKQYQEIIKILEKYNFHNQSILLAGDFNDWNKKSCQILQDRIKMKEVFKSFHGFYPKTYPSFLPLLKLDRIYYKNMNVLSAHALKDSSWGKISDHLPLYAKLSWPNNE